MDTLGRELTQYNHYQEKDGNSQQRWNIFMHKRTGESERDTHTPTLIAAIFVTTKIKKQSHRLMFMDRLWIKNVKYA